jgi:hypothetical protein
LTDFFTLALVLILSTLFHIVLKSYTKNAEKRIEDFKEGFSKGFEAVNHTKPFVNEEIKTGIDDYSDEDLYHLEHGDVEEEKLEYVDREDEWRD